MIIVADTTPISELTKVDYLDLLPQLFGEVIISEGVFNELKVGQHPAAEIILDLPWLKVLSINNYQKVKALQEKYNLACIIHERIAKKPESLMPSGIWRFDPNNSL
ncbi:hypothetical protein [Crocosphaera chwakensis]|uniref:Uncharacterized protein n=1 Tax=Crocosphaera chwakensis CCY0110 TaxID=391612 RepID=A3IN52_9CHRO|nr:hypothetical protein [Crocosphaera chwakensis]EAZ92029.1 hypothetical protein CY0110_00185 [Crocosphaera chwakensis CCY0110]